MTKIVELKTPAVVDLSDALEVLDTLRAQIVSGEIKAFICVGVCPDHDTTVWMAQTKKTTRLEMLGALNILNHCFVNGDI